MVQLDLLRARGLGGQLTGDANYCLFKPLFLWKVKFLGRGALFDMEGLHHHSCIPAPVGSPKSGGASAAAEAKVCTWCPAAWLDAELPPALLFSVTCLSTGNPSSPSSGKKQKGNLNFVKSPALLTQPGIHRKLSRSDGPGGSRCKLPVTLAAFPLALLQHGVQSMCSHQIFHTSALWI